MEVAAELTQSGVAFDTGSDGLRTLHRFVAPVTAIGEVPPDRGMRRIAERIGVSRMRGSGALGYGSQLVSHDGVSLARKIQAGDRAHIERKTSLRDRFRPAALQHLLRAV
jgi:hypothetical protein